MTTTADIAIVGGGVIGLTTAFLLARDGVRVELLDKGDFGQEASWAGAGILPPASLEYARHPFDRLRAVSRQLLPEVCADLYQRTGIDSGLVHSGGLELAGAGEAADEQEWRSAGIECRFLDTDEARKREPALAANVAGAWYLPGLAQLRNPRLLKALIAGCYACGVRMTPACPVHRLELRGRRVLGLRTVRGLLAADRVLIAAGAWSDALLEQAGWTPGIRPVRGQIVLLNTRVLPFRHVLMWGPRYLVPRPDGRVLIGSTEEHAGFDKRTTAQAVADLLALACRLVPVLGEAAVERCWAGLRPGSPDGLPFLGAVPGWDNLFVAAGHFRAGIQLSAGTGLVMKELLLGQPLTLGLEAFRLDRLDMGAVGGNC
jgi:glycine oxidase